jgi:hypothetical protein
MSRFNLGPPVSLSTPNNPFMLPHRPAPPIPEKKPSSSNEENQIEMQQNHNSPTPQPMENIYSSAKELPPSLIKEEDKDLSEKLQSNLNTTEEKHPSIPLDDQVRKKTKSYLKKFFYFI